MKRRLLITAGMVLFLGLGAACAGSESDTEAAAEALATSSSDAAMAAELDRLRVASARFEDVNVALAAGYIPDPSGMCITAEMEGMPAELGAMGLHYLRPDLLGLVEAPGRVNGTGTHTDFNEPAVLLYEPQMDGSMQLIGIENLVWVESWNGAGHTTGPEFNGVAYNHMFDDPATEADEAHGFEPHYDLHVWLQRENPRGVFEQFNPSVTCAHGAHAAAPGRP